MSIKKGFHAIRSETQSFIFNCAEDALSHLDGSTGFSYKSFLSEGSANEYARGYDSDTIVKELNKMTVFDLDQEAVKDVAHDKTFFYVNKHGEMGSMLRKSLYTLKVESSGQYNRDTYAIFYRYDEDDLEYVANEKVMLMTYENAIKKFEIYHRLYGRSE